MSNPKESIAWEEVIKKEARSAIDEYDFGEVQEVGQNYVLTQKGLVNKEKFYIPKHLVEGFDGSTLRFKASKDELQGWKHDSPPDFNENPEYTKQEMASDIKQEHAEYKKQEMASDIETRVQLIEERLNVSKHTTTSEAIITKEPVTETKTVEVPLTHEELTIERRPVTESSSTTTSERPVESKTEIKIPVNREEIDVRKEPYVKEEVILKKKPVTETKTISDTVRSEKIDISGAETKTISDTVRSEKTPDSQIYRENVRIEQEKLGRHDNLQHDDKALLGADTRNPYNDPTLPYYNPILDKKNASRPSVQ
jgi:uncharacterized protein (TIGR02271 family)